jgi:hypothetical protein
MLNCYRGQLQAMRSRLAAGGHPAQAAQAARLHNELGNLLDDRRR